MTQEQQTKLEQTYEFHAKEGTVIRETDSLSTFLIGAQTILDNPDEWGLQDIEDSDEEWCEVVDSFKQERDHYRRALEDVDIELSHEGYANSSGEGVDKARTIIKEALKQ